MPNDRSSRAVVGLTGNSIYGGVGFAHTPIYTPFPCWRLFFFSRLNYGLKDEPSLPIDTLQNHWILRDELGAIASSWIETPSEEQAGCLAHILSHLPLYHLPLL